MSAVDCSTVGKRGDARTTNSASSNHSPAVGKSTSPAVEIDDALGERLITGSRLRLHGTTTSVHGIERYLASARYEPANGANRADPLIADLNDRSP